MPYDDFHIDVEGHTDSTPISSQVYPSNWELSTTRASKIVKYFTHMGISKQRLKASGYADSQPRAPNQDSLGNPIPENKDLNRRIVLRLYYTAADTQQTDPDFASIETVQQPDLSSTCQYSVQAGSFASFPEGFNFLRRTEERTSYDFDITYNGSQFSVRTKPKPAYSQALDAYQRISSHVEQSSTGLIHQCYDSRQASPEPLNYRIQFGAFQSKQNALAYMAGLTDEHQISTHLADHSSDFFKVVSGPYQETETAIAKLNLFAEQQLSNGLFIDYISATPRRYYFEGQLQLGQFSSETKARAYAEHIENEMDIPIRVTQFDASTYSVVPRTFKSWREGVTLKNRVEDQILNQFTMLHLLEFSPPQPSPTGNNSR